MVGPLVVLFVVFLCSGFRSPFTRMLCFTIVFVMKVAVFCPTDSFKAISLSQFMLVRLRFAYETYVLFLFIHHVSTCWCLGGLGL